MLVNMLFFLTYTTAKFGDLKLGLLEFWLSKKCFLYSVRPQQIRDNKVETTTMHESLVTHIFSCLFYFFHSLNKEFFAGKNQEFVLDEVGRICILLPVGGIKSTCVKQDKLGKLRAESMCI